MGDPRHDLGLAAEELVAQWLTKAGWSILARRWRSRGHGELDLVCRDTNGTLVGIEVRARLTARAGGAAESVDRRRIGRLRATLGAFIAERCVSNTGIRIDLVTVEPAEADASAGTWRVVRTPMIDAW
jgi:putative endonuclease